MKVLWITNILFPEAEKLLSGSGELKSTGGWMLGMAEALQDTGKIELYVASVSKKVSKLKKVTGKNTIYYILPYCKGNTRINYGFCPLWKQIQKEVKPDIVHIHGTEFSHGHAYMKACGNDNVVISIQGLISVYQFYYLSGLSKKDIYLNISVRDLVKGSIIQNQKRFKKRAEYEVEMVKMAKHIIGRTSWDRTRIWAINPKAEYHFCNEVLRPEFYYDNIWNYEKCVKHSIFISQAGYPIKGLHQVLKAMPLILQYYPDTTIRIAGNNITADNTLREKIRISGYGKYIKRLIKKNKISDKITFTGDLNASEMRFEYLNANIFVCPSSIENSPNSLGEAQILGVPCVSSYVGGVMDMMKGNEENLYRFEEIEMLAEKICRVFASKNEQINMHSQAMKRHNIEDNCKSLIKIYELVSNNASIY